MTERNQACPCGSGLKYKKCCASKDTRRAQFPTGLAVLAGGLVVIAAVGVAPSLLERKQQSPAKPPVVTEASATSTLPPDPNSPFAEKAADEAETSPSEQPAGDPPPGKVWSAEHGHWHDAAPANKSIQIEANNLGSGLSATQGERPERGTPPEPGATWSEEHGHWHKAGTNQAITAPRKQAIDPNTGAPIGRDPAPQDFNQVRAFGELQDLTPKPGTPAPPGPAPDGMEWSVEHGHWHEKPKG